MTNKKLYALTSLILLTCTVYASAKPQAPTDYNTYDGLAPGGKCMAMGYAYCAAGNDPSAIFFNPAGLSTVEKNTLSITYEAARQSKLTTEEIFRFEKLKNKNLIFASLNSHQGAFSWHPVANNVSRETIGSDWQETETKINAYKFTATSKHGKKLYSGLNITYMNGRIGQAKFENNIPYINISEGHGISFDFGMIYMLSNEFRLGFNLKNLAGFMWWDDYSKDLLPFCARAGYAFQMSNFITFSTDWEQRYYRKGDKSTQNYIYFGTEQNIIKGFQLRAGIYGQDLNDKETSHLTYGIGYYKNNYRLSLAGEKYRIDLTDVFRYLFSIDIPL